MGAAEAAALLAAAAVWILTGPPLAVLRLGLARRTQGDSLPRHSLAGAAKTWAADIRARRRLEQLWRTSVIELCDGMAAELAAGRTPGEAFTASAAVLDRRVAAELLSPDSGVTTAKRFHDSPADEPSTTDRLERLATRPGAGGLRLLAACWRIGAERGGTLATVLDGLASALRDEEAQRQDVTAQLAGPRATARLLAGLPLLGLGMAAALGANPLAFLFGTLPGACCLAVGVGLDATGLWWTQRLAKAAETSR
ncbi:type II secretion system protein [Actinomadura rudentiformis]|uniref:Type II secretion system protein n=1 Tax=Actinomadura rudentiformis TaxID=359158 RepID=A0A6H9Z7I9_9ACTN|nr:type II secretion system protein [Actinomadura rudentiformis]